MGGGGGGWGGICFVPEPDFLLLWFLLFFTRNKRSIPPSSAFDHSWHHFGVFYSARISAPLTNYRQFKKREEKRHQQWIFSLFEIHFAEKGNEISVSQIFTIICFTSNPPNSSINWWKTGENCSVILCISLMCSATFSIATTASEKKT